MTTTLEADRVDDLQARRSMILTYWELDDRGFAPVMARRDLQGDEWRAEAELDRIDFMLASPR